MARRSVFISYARLDRDEVLGAVDLLRAGGVTVFLDVVDIDFGERWKDALAKALAGCERVLVFWSRAAAASEWVEREWRYALSLGKKIVPTLLDVTPLPPELAEFQAVRAARPAPAAPRAASSARRPAALVAGAVLLGALAVGGYAWLTGEHDEPRSASPPPVSVQPEPRPPPPGSGRPPIVAEPSRPAPAQPPPVQSDLAEQLLSPLGWAIAALVLLLLGLAARRARRDRAPAEAADFVERVFSA